MVKENIREAIRRYWPVGKGKIGKREAAVLLERALAEGGIMSAGDGRKMQNGFIETHRNALCLMSAELDGSLHLRPLRAGQEIDVLLDPHGGWRRCRVVLAPAGAPTVTQIDAGEEDAPVIGSPARIPLQIDGSRMPAKKFEALGESKGGGQDAANMENAK